MPKYIEMEGAITIDLTAIFEQVRKPKKEEDKPTEEKDEKCQITS